MDLRAIDILHELERTNTALQIAIAERDAARSEVATYRKTLDEVSEIGTNAIAERDALRAALVSLVDGKSEFDIEFDTGMDVDEARRIMDLAYNRK